MAAVSAVITGDRAGTWMTPDARPMRRVRAATAPSTLGASERNPSGASAMP